MRRIEAALNEAITAAKIAGVSDTELVDTLKMLIQISED
jgi:hypothetical protein